MLSFWCAGYKIPVIENLGATLVSKNFCLLLSSILFDSCSVTVIMTNVILNFAKVPPTVIF